MPWLRGLLGDLIQYDPHTLKPINPVQKPKETMMEATTGTAAPTIPTFTEKLEYLEKLATAVGVAASAVEILAYKTYGFSGNTIGGAIASNATPPKPDSALGRLSDAAGQIDYQLGRISAAINAMNDRA